MKALILLVSSLIFSAVLLGQAYVCSIDYYEHISKYEENALTTATTAIFSLDDCKSGKKTSYENIFGQFRLQISCQDKISINLSQRGITYNEIIEPQDFGKRFFKSYINERSGLKINCQGRTIGQTIVVEIFSYQLDNINSLDKDLRTKEIN